MSVDDQAVPDRPARMWAPTCECGHYDGDHDADPRTGWGTCLRPCCDCHEFNEAAEPVPDRPDTAVAGHSAHGYVDPFDHPELPLVKRILAVCWDDMDPKDIPGRDSGDGAYATVSGLIADHDWHTDLAIANTMGLVGEWGTDDVHEAVTNALHEYCGLRAALAERDATIARVRALHRPVDGLGFLGDGTYGAMSPVCSACGKDDEYGVWWPCPTLAALEGREARHG